MMLDAAEALAIFLGGLLGSAHCVGMCGGFALSLGIVGKSWKLNLGRQALYGLGRVFTYTAGGVMAGYTGAQLAAWLPSVTWLQAVLCVGAGLLLIAEGLAATGCLPRAKSEASCLAPGMFGALLRASRLQSVFLGGMINGLLPCGLVYAYLALAGSSRKPLVGGAVMLLFGLGTLPALALLGMGAGRLSQALRTRLLTLAAFCVIATGILSCWRGYSFLAAEPGQAEEACPLCVYRPAPQ